MTGYSAAEVLKARISMQFFKIALTSLSLSGRLTVSEHDLPVLFVEDVVTSSDS
jgi:hypothetical protein